MAPGLLSAAGDITGRFFTKGKGKDPFCQVALTYKIKRGEFFLVTPSNKCCSELMLFSAILCQGFKVIFSDSRTGFCCAECELRLPLHVLPAQSSV